jgi:predicted metalloendopeptidase
MSSAAVPFSTLEVEEGEAQGRTRAEHQLRAQNFRWRMLAGLLGVTCIGLIAAFSASEAVSSPDTGEGGGSGPSDVVSAELEQLAVNMTASLDTSTAPCDDFYRYSCGGWLDAKVLPDDKTRFTRSFTSIYEANVKAVRRVYEADWPLIGPYYKSCMDTAAIESLGVAPIEPHLSQIQAARNTTELMAVAGTLYTQGVSAFFSLWIGADDRAPLVQQVQLHQAPLSLPDRAYYLDPAVAGPIRANYTAHVARMLLLSGSSPDALAAAAAAESVYVFEAALANASWARARLRDPEATYHKMTWAQLVDGATGLRPRGALLAYLRGTGVAQKVAALEAEAEAAAAAPWRGEGGGGGVTANVAVPSFFAALGSLMADDGSGAAVPLATLRSYLQWRVVSHFASQLPAALSREHFDFFGRVLYGAKARSPRWERCVAAASAPLGELAGRYWAAEAFAGASRETAEALVQDIESTFWAELKAATWLDAATRARAGAKLGKLANLIGHPANWTDFSGLAVDSGQFLGNGVGASQWSWRTKELAALGKPTDRSVWYMDPQTVNAYYAPSENRMVRTAWCARLMCLCGAPAWSACLPACPMLTPPLGTLHC